MEINHTNKKNTVQKGFIGIALILIGIMLLVSKWVNFGAFILILPGLVMMGLGIYNKEAGWIIPGSIVGSIGTSALIIENTNAALLNETNQGAIFMLTFAAGWFLIVLLTWIFTAKPHVWALIPGGILAAFGGLLLLGQPGLSILEYSNYLWPILLVAGGVFILIKAFQR